MEVAGINNQSIIYCLTFNAQFPGHLLSHSIQALSVNLYKLSSIKQTASVGTLMIAGAYEIISGSKCSSLSLELWFTAAHYDLLFALINRCHSVLQLNAADCYDLSIPAE